MWQDRLKKIIEILESSSVNEIEISFWGRRYRVSKGGNVIANSAPATSVVSSAPSAVTDVNTTQRQPASDNAPVITGNEVKSPIVGTYYSAPSPESPPFINVGDHVTTGQTLCIVEAMKIMNEIESEVSGRIDKIIVENAQPVEFGQTLFIITPD